ncbi:hypothetical protein SAMN05421837_101238 [Amycolatopsis pretoriensis]|uniref:Uncharacterized protein n=1 Tax=Amycolatopsis pretoriensis TaxID=218821 RepID=A0A1H5Q278_9PSEU|nr:hypothetical protein [Amycolatopsis pretoriensis]SEF20125.1 hypothetical protein SAMN05421837_101238 [Amycolatopsis pretoriensis]
MNHQRPASIRELARSPAWTVTGSRGRWSTAERVLSLGSHHWVVGLTPTAGGATALMLWCDDEVIAHRRGPEAALCETALRWEANLLAGRPWDGR